MRSWIRATLGRLSGLFGLIRRPAAVHIDWGSRTRDINAFIFLKNLYVCIYLRVSYVQQLGRAKWNCRPQFFLPLSYLPSIHLKILCGTNNLFYFSFCFHLRIELRGIWTREWAHMSFDVDLLFDRRRLCVNKKRVGGRERWGNYGNNNKLMFLSFQ